MDNKRYFNRELSWLSFNHRVLQEAKNPDVPLLERIRFMGIYSSNLDEFFRVRVGYYRSLLALKKKTKRLFDVHPKSVLKGILQKVNRQQNELGSIFNQNIKGALAALGIYFRDEKEVTPYQKKKLTEYFNTEIKPLINPVVLKSQKPFLDNHVLYFALSLQHKLKLSHSLGFLKIPSDQLPRFKTLKHRNKTYSVFFLDDIIRLFLNDLFPKYTILSCNAIKLSRNAQMDLDEFELSSSLLEKVKKGLSKRLVNPPSRFLYDQNMPAPILSKLMSLLELTNFDIVKGARYHNFSDFMKFPNPGSVIPIYKLQQPLPYPALENTDDIFLAISKSDYLLHYPYQSYNPVIQLFKQVAKSKEVEEIMITLYRVSSKSAVAKSLIHAAKNGIKVTALVEIKARFDEESNIKWANKMEKAGVRVIYSHPSLKVHSKIALVTFKKNATHKHIAYLATGNFNENTAKIYCDEGLFTANKEITNDLKTVFKILKNDKARPKFKQLLVAPFTMRSAFEELLDHEMKQAQKGKPAFISLKMNSLEDQDMINKLYEAANVGVKIKLIIRGICCLVPGIKGMSKNIKVISIVGRFLEHARIYHFHHSGKDLVYLASADWMNRNLSKRIEVAFPLLDVKLKAELLYFLKLQWKDNTKARIINSIQNNPYKPSTAKKKLNAQLAFYEYIKSKHN